MGRRILEIADVFLPILMGAGEKHYEVTKDPLPDDCRIINAKMHFRGCGTQTLVLLLESGEWDDAPALEQSRVEPIFTDKSMVTT